MTFVPWLRMSKNNGFGSVLTVAAFGTLIRLYKPRFALYKRETLCGDMHFI